MEIFLVLWNAFNYFGYLCWVLAADYQIYAAINRISEQAGFRTVGNHMGSSIVSGAVDRADDSRGDDCLVRNGDSGAG